jgi:hypothetical protein
MGGPDKGLHNFWNKQQGVAQSQSIEHNHAPLPYSPPHVYMLQDPHQPYYMVAFRPLLQATASPPQLQAQNAPPAHSCYQLASRFHYSHTLTTPQHDGQLI